MDTEDWKRLYQAFNHKVRLEADEQALFVERPRNVAREILGDIQLERTGKWVFCGSIGSGKSSELVHLSTLLDDSFLVVPVDLFAVVADISRIQPAEVVLLLGAASLVYAQAQGELRQAKELESGMRAAFDGLLQRREWSVDWSTLLGAVGGASLMAALHNPVGAVTAGAAGVKALSRRPAQPRIPLSGITRALVEDGEPDAVALLDAVNRILNAIQDELGRTPVLLVDGLDKIEEIKKIRQVFTATRLLAGLEAPTVYSAPVALMRAPEWQLTANAFERKRLFNIIVARPSRAHVDIGADLIASGRAALIRVVERRVVGLGFKVDQVFEADALDRLITASGGVLRSLIFIVNRAIRQAFTAGDARIGIHHADLAIRELSGEYEIGITTEMMTELIHVRDSGKLSRSDDVIHDLTMQNYVLPYKNSRDYWACAPLVERLLPEPAAAG